MSIETLTVLLGAEIFISVIFLCHALCAKNTVLHFDIVKDVNEKDIKKLQEKKKSIYVCRIIAIIMSIAAISGGVTCLIMLVNYIITNNS